MRMKEIKSLQDIQYRKWQLKGKMTAQRQEILDIAKDLQTDLRPRNLLSTVTGGLLSAAPVLGIGVAKNIGTVASFFIKDSRKATLVKWLLPLAVMAAPKMVSLIKEYLPDIQDDIKSVAYRFGILKNDDSDY